VTSGHRSVDIAALPEGSVFFAKSYQLPDIAKTMHDLLAVDRK
jgi:hypothetical protein